MTRSWPVHLVCILCDQDLETAGHLRLHCVYSREVWFSVTSWADVTIQMPMLTLSTEEWWNEAMRGRPKAKAGCASGGRHPNVYNVESVEREKPSNLPRTVFNNSYGGSDDQGRAAVEGNCIGR
jgi:hypothetical protein